jgi:hypothetical protein
MKKLILIIIVLFSQYCFSQTINLKVWNGDIINGAYYKDIDQELNQFEGTYQLITNNGNDELTMVFKKHTEFYMTPYTEDVLVGEIKYKKDGIVLFDNLNKINLNLPNKYSHDICGNTLVPAGGIPPCDDCLPNQYRASLIFFGRQNNKGGGIYLQKIVENGVQKIKVLILYTNSIVYDNDPVPVPIISYGEYILTRIN